MHRLSILIVDQQARVNRAAAAIHHRGQARDAVNSSWERLPPIEPF